MGTAEIRKCGADWLLAALLLAGFVLTSSILTLRPAAHTRTVTIATSR